MTPGTKSQPSCAGAAGPRPQHWSPGRSHGARPHQDHIRTTSGLHQDHIRTTSGPHARIPPSQTSDLDLPPSAGPALTCDQVSDPSRHASERWVIRLVVHVLQREPEVPRPLSRPGFFIYPHIKRKSLAWIHQPLINVSVRLLDVTGNR